MQLAKTGKEQQIWVDTLMMVYDQRIKYFAPISKLYGEAYLLGRKGVDLYKYRNASMETAYNILKKSIELGGKNSEYAVIQTAMQLVVAMYNSNKIDASVVVEKYILLSDLLEQKKVDDNTKLATATDDKTRTRAQSDLATCAQVENNVFSLFSNSTAAQCNVLIQTFSEKLKSSPNDIDLCEKIVRILDLKGCTNSQLYEDAIKKIVAKHPSESACFDLGKNLERKGEIDDAIENYKKAIVLASTDANAAIYNCSIAKLLQQKNQYVDARSYAHKAIALNPNYGLPYIIIATMYGDNPVGNSSFEKSLTYWLVIDKLQKAKSVDPSIADEAQQLIDRYSSVCPKKEESFIHSIISGKTITIGGWINETTTARF
jgi:tetratricopeptide (TPR) repeat protein